MKDRGILHPQLGRLLAETGHTDVVGVCDAGFPIPVGPERVDLGYAPGQAPLLSVLDAVLGDLRVEAYMLAEESRAQASWLVDALRDRLPDAEARWMSHQELKAAAGSARVMVRTGEFRAFANVLLVSGVDFDAAG